jgi:homoserine dehydrogenase
MGRTLTRYHVSLDVADRPGVLAQVAQVFSAQKVSIEAVRQRLLPGADPADGSHAELVVVTHTATDAALSATVEALSDLPVVRAVNSVMRVEGDR